MTSVHAPVGVTVVWQGALYGAAEIGASMTHQTFEHHFDTVVIGGGQAGLAMGCFLAQQDRDFVIVDGGSRVGDVWRSRWVSLRAPRYARWNARLGIHPISANPK